MVRAGKSILGARADKYKLRARVGKYKLGARVGKYKLGTRVRGRWPSKGLGPGKLKDPVIYVNQVKIRIMFNSN